MDKPSPTFVRFGVLGFLCSLALITYLDRICISRVALNMQQDLHISDKQMGLVFSAFLLGYLLFEVPGGWLGDVFGARRTLTAIVLWWSLFTAMTGCVWAFSWDRALPLLMIDSVLLLLLVRFLFGCGEAGAFPNVARVVGVWFPFRERAFAQGGIWMCARLGGFFAPLVIGRLTKYLGGWRPAFWLLGVLGVGWAVVFWFWFRDRPEEKPGCNAAERDLIQTGKPATTEPAHGHDLPPWGLLLHSPTLAGLCLAAACASFSWYIYATWQPKFYKDVFGWKPEQTELVCGLPFLFGAAGCLLGGRLSDYLVRTRGSRRWGRSLLGVTGFGLAGLCVLLSAHVGELWQAAALLCLGSFCNDLGIPVIWAVCADVGGRFAGTISGIMNMVGGLGAVLTPALIPYWIDPEHPAESWPWVFGVLAASWFVGALSWLLVDAGKRMVPDDS
jgi:MFS transporter, ACS family, glucarate transporter